MKRLFGHKRDKNGGGSNGKPKASPESAKARPTNPDGTTSRKPGALSDDTSSFRVMVPDGVEPGQEFQVYAGQRIVRVRCPPNTKPGQYLQINVPVDKTAMENAKASAGSAQSNSGRSNSHGPPDSPNVTKLEREGNNPQAYMVEIPEEVRGGQRFLVTIAGQQLTVDCPINARPGSQVRIVPPPPPPQTEDANSTANIPGSTPTRSKPPKDDATQLFEVMVPPGVMPGKPFALLAGGVRVLVTCPINARPGQRIRFQLPLALTQKPKHSSEAAQIKLAYDKDGWTRTIRASDMKFQWVRMDDKGDIDTNTRFDSEKSAYVRKLDFREGLDARVRDGILTFVPAADAFVDSRVKNDAGEVVVTYAEIAEAQVKDFQEKVNWFQNKCTSALGVEWNEGHMRMNVRRDHLLEDSVDAVMSLSRKDMRKLWRFEFIGEAGIDAGGLAREWFQLVTDEIFDPDMGFWQSSETNQMCMQINPASQMIHEDFKVYYRFLGRVMGKALFDRQLVAGHMVQFIYKHMLGWPIQFKDIRDSDEELYFNLKQLTELAANGEDLEMLCLDFTTTVEVMGAKQAIELVDGGADIEVTNDNFPEYLEACMKYRMIGRVKEQLNELLLGFFDVIPEPLLTIFDFQELELLMCGLPEIDMQDWQDHTEYSGDYENIGGEYPTCQWFWEVVGEFDQETKARLLQFVTGTSGVPSRGFGVLQGNDGNVRKFTIHGVSVGTCLYPRAHTCFNRIDLPMYETKEELKEKLKLAVTMCASGFDIE
jgi:hypothetical protein